MTITEDPDFRAFWRERHYSTLTTFRPDGTPHVVPVSVTYDPAAGVARVVASRSSRKVRNIAAAPAGKPAARVALCQVDGRRWATLEGRAAIRTDPELITDAELHYAERYGRSPRPNPERVLIEITVDRAMGRPAPAPSRGRGSYPR
ncbi:TIGR03618 family F420-dependent PPOX class oxidoreductase [Streptomyces sp. N2-109]|uniref:TIGR03618 family F420-dependent PPOX class oxidoreductase n=1 Tax=Streptomyces gossypii TaxID=2883101 RepID=A0ABT2JP89_9ACTN|nr:TIGR03618 family F420-dependent PPOX class oxidoreductase [Streptomyces gossypii]MCT2589693.1 TIGR03618 family F420-dependent PPOX class oxidoreductase [Streptomyces gossypii]